MTGHSIQVWYPINDDGIHLLCECGWDCNIGFNRSVADLAEAELKHQLSVPPAPMPPMDVSPDEVDAFMEAIGETESQGAVRLLDRVLGNERVVLWFCPDDDNETHRAAQASRKPLVQWTPAMAGQVPVCLVCGQTGVPR